MKKKLSMLISIPEPCTQEWNAMEQLPGGRQCGLCQKAVVDFTRMTDAQLLDYFRQHTSTSCGRFTSIQLDRTLKYAEVPRSLWGARLAAGILLLLGLSKPASGQSKRDSVRVPYRVCVEQSPNIPQPETFAVEGTLLDKKGRPVENAKVSLLIGETVIGYTLTNAQGIYGIRIPYAPDVSDYSLKLSDSGYELIFTHIPNSKETLMISGQFQGRSATISYRREANDPIKQSVSGTYVLHGSLKDEKGDPVVNANVSLVNLFGVYVARTLTDFDGLFQINIPYSSEPKTYDLKFAYIGDEITITGVPNNPGTTRVDGRINLTSREKTQVIIMGGPVPLIDWERRSKQNKKK